MLQQAGWPARQVWPAAGLARGGYAVLLEGQLYVLLGKADAATGVASCRPGKWRLCRSAGGTAVCVLPGKADAAHGDAPCLVVASAWMYTASTSRPSKPAASFSGSVAPEQAHPHQPRKLPLLPQSGLPSKGPLPMGSQFALSLAQPDRLSCDHYTCRLKMMALP